MMDECAAIGHRPMEIQDQGDRVEVSTADLRGASMPPLLDARIASLMWSFAQLSPHGQKRYMELLNAYLYASPRQRKQMRSDWMVAYGQSCAHGDEQGPHWQQERRKA